MYRILVTPPKDTEAQTDIATDHATEHASHRSRSTAAHKAANVELLLDGDLAGLTLCGFSVWDNGREGRRVSFPTRRYVAAGGNRASFLLLRATDPRNRSAYERLQREILDAYEAFVQGRSTSMEAAS